MQTEITPHPDFETFTSDELVAHRKKLEDDISFGSKNGADKAIVTWLIQERRSCVTELERRNGNHKETVSQQQQGAFWPELLTSKALGDLPQDSTNWIWDRCLPFGGCSVLVAKPKVGKSTLAAALALAISRGEPFFGRKTTQSNACYISLDASLSEMVELLNSIGMKSTDPFFLHAGKAPDRAIEWALDMIHRYEIKFLVIDTLQKLFHFKNINDYSEVNNLTEPMLDGCREKNCQVMFTTHAKKESIDDLDSAIGSAAIRGMAYTYLHIKRLPESDIRIFRTDQRAGTNFEEYAIGFDKFGVLDIQGTREETEVDMAKPQILEFFRSEPDSTERELRSAVLINGKILAKALRRLLRDNEIERTGKGRRGDPFKYTVAKKLTDMEAKVIELFPGAKKVDS